VIQAPVELTQDQRKYIEEYVLGDHFPWFRTAYQVGIEHVDNASPYVDSAFFSHQLMKRSDTAISGQINSPHFEFFAEIFADWMHSNSQPFTHIYRAAINCVYPGKGISTPHLDHSWHHNNWIMYLTTNASAETILFNLDLTIEHAIPCEQYTAVSFSQQLHAHRYPTTDQRVVVVFTYA
jgi:hypothetical protein